MHTAQQKRITMAGLTEIVKKLAQKYNVPIFKSVPPLPKPEGLAEPARVCTFCVVAIVPTNKQLLASVPAAVQACLPPVFDVSEKQPLASNAKRQRTDSAP